MRLREFGLRKSLSSSLVAQAEREPERRGELAAEQTPESAMPAWKASPSLMRPPSLQAPAADAEPWTFAEVRAEEGTRCEMALAAAKVATGRAALEACSAVGLVDSEKAQDPILPATAGLHEAVFARAIPPEE